MLRSSIQKKQIALRERQLKIANEVAEKEKWSLVVDKNTPGVLFVANAIDRTDSVLKAVDAKYLDKSMNIKTVNTAVQTAKKESAPKGKNEVKTV